MSYTSETAVCSLDCTLFKVKEGAWDQITRGAAKVFVFSGLKSGRVVVTEGTEAVVNFFLAADTVVEKASDTFVQFPDTTSGDMYGMRLNSTGDTDSFVGAFKETQKIDTGNLFSGSTMVAKHAYASPLSGHLKLKDGDLLLYVQPSAKTGWSRAVKSSDKSYGLFPTSFAEPKMEAPLRRASSSALLAFTSGSAPAPSKRGSKADMPQFLGGANTSTYFAGGSSSKASSKNNSFSRAADAVPSVSSSSSSRSSLRASKKMSKLTSGEGNQSVDSLAELASNSASSSSLTTPGGGRPRSLSRSSITSTSSDDRKAAEKKEKADAKEDQKIQKKKDRASHKTMRNMLKKDKTASIGGPNMIGSKSSENLANVNGGPAGSPLTTLNADAISGPVASPSGGGGDMALMQEIQMLKSALHQSSKNAKEWEQQLALVRNDNAKLYAALQDSVEQVGMWKEALQKQKEATDKAKKKFSELVDIHKVYTSIIDA